MGVGLDNIEYSKKDLLEIAKHQKIICWLFLIILIGLIFPVISLVAHLIAIFFVYYLTKALKLPRPWLYAIGIFVPLVSLIVLLTVIRKATKALRLNNIRVGIMGANKKDLDKLLTEDSRPVTRNKMEIRKTEDPISKKSSDGCLKESKISAEDSMERHRMRIDFDKLNLSQKIYSIVGLVSAIVVYMNDKDALNVAIGIILLTIIVAFLMRYKAIKIFCNISVALLVVSLVVLGLIEIGSDKKERMQTDISRGNNIDLKQSSQSREPQKYEITLVDGRTFVAEFYGTPTEKEMDDAAEKFRVENPEPFFRIGSTKADVKRIQGTPTSIIGDMWCYGLDRVVFDFNGHVTSYMNSSGKLKVK
jgi:hypothetical protein